MPLKVSRRTVPFLLALALATAIASPAAGYSVISETGMVGPWFLTDSVETPAATCGYSREYPPNSAFLRWVKVRPPVVRAADRDAAKIDHKRVAWLWKLQKSTLGETTWNTVATSPRQTAIAYENQPARFTASRINYSVGVNYQSPAIFRALVVIRWVKADGTIEGRVKARALLVSPKGAVGDIDLRWPVVPGAHHVRLSPSSARPWISDI